MKIRKTPRKRRKTSSNPKPTQNMKSRKDWVPVRIPENIEEMVNAWVNYQGPKIGWCFLCNGPIRSADQLLGDSGTHDCEAGRSLEENIHATELGQQRGQISDKRSGSARSNRGQT